MYGMTYKFCIIFRKSVIFRSSYCIFSLMIYDILFSEESRGASALSIGCVTKGVILAITNVSAVPAVRVNRAGPMAVVSGIPGLANARARPRVTPDN